MRTLLTSTPQSPRSSRRAVVRALAVPLIVAAVGTAAAPGVITISRGDTLWEIARERGTTVAALRALNGLPGNSSTIYAGQTLKVPAGASTTPTSSRISSKVSASAAAHRATLARRSQPSKAYVQQLISRTARAKGVDPALALAVAYNESGFQQDVVSPVDAIGVMQVIPSTGAWLARDVVGRPLDLLDVEDNVLAGVTLLATLVKSVGVEQGLAGYYQGFASIRAKGVLPQTKQYITVVLALRERFR
jgi:LysM repeat protein